MQHGEENRTASVPMLIPQFDCLELTASKLIHAFESVA